MMANKDDDALMRRQGAQSARAIEPGQRFAEYYNLTSIFEVTHMWLYYGHTVV
jgi:hypothetical protein